MECIVISIHTPAKGATTIIFPFQLWILQISIHTPAKGATVFDIDLVMCYLNFNPHTREGCDSHVSGFGNIRGYFNPHTREGCDLSYKERKLKI